MKRIQLAVHMNARGRECLYGEGFCSTDEHLESIKEAFSKINIEYSEPFFCIAVYRKDEDPHDIKLPIVRAFGAPVILKPSILNRIQVACAYDIQNGASPENNYDIRSIFRNLQNVSDKEAVLLELLTMRIPQSWSEARVFGCLTESDVLEDRYRQDYSAAESLMDFDESEEDTL